MSGPTGKAQAQNINVQLGTINSVPTTAASASAKVGVIVGVVAGVVACAAIAIPLGLVLSKSSSTSSTLNCYTVAASFFTTCGSYTTPVASLNNTSGYTVTCNVGFTASTCPGNYSGGVCVFSHKMCVTCSGTSTVRIRVQSNGLPRFCPSTPSAVSEQNIDFEVNFNPSVSINSLNQNATSVSSLSSIVCNIFNQASAPSASNLVVYGSSLTTLAGVSVDGVSILNANSLNDVDPFYPAGGVAAEVVDACLGHTNGQNAYHYHMSSGCALNPPSGAITSCAANASCSSNISSYSIWMFNSYRTLTVIGIAKDGHVIYGPYDSTGAEVTSGYDICNGMFYNSAGDYAYFSTRKFPYITGCFGPGNYPSFSVNCSLNAPTSYSMSAYAG